jgi:hypothetical protein
LEICEAPNIVRSVYIHSILKARTYVCVWPHCSTCQCSNGRSQLLWCDLYHSTFLQKWHTWKLLWRAFSWNTNFRINLYEAVWDSILFTDTLPSSTVAYYEQYFNMLMLGVWLSSKFYRNITAFCWWTEKFGIIYRRSYRDLNLKRPEQKFQQSIIC